MRNALPVLGVLIATVAVVAALAWARAGRDRYEALEREGVGLARVVEAAVKESEALLSTAERYLAARLETIARRIDDRLDRSRRPAGELMQDVAEEEHVGRIFLFDADLEPIARARTPRPLELGQGTLLTSDEKTRLEWEEARRAVMALAPSRQQAVTEGFRENLYGTRTRFGVAYGRRLGGSLLLRANADELADLDRRFGLATRLEHVAALPQVLDVRLASVDGVTLLAAGPHAEPTTARPLPRLSTLEPSTMLEPEALRTVLPLTGGAGTVIDLRLDRAGADESVDRSRRAILLGGLLAILVASMALLFVRSIEQRHRAERIRVAEKLAEERRLAEVGALAGLVTHEVSNPLNAMRFAMQLLLEEKDVDEQQRLLQALREGTDQIAASVEGFLRRAVAPTVPHRAVDSTLLERVRARAQDAADRRGVPIDVHRASARQAFVDPVVVEEALLNLVRNAVQASPAGTRVGLAWTDAPKGFVRIRVTDGGPGFPEDREALLRLGASKVAEGHGLGLPLARRFIDAQGGRIVLGDADGGGACVDVFLPGAPPEEVVT